MNTQWWWRRNGRYWALKKNEGPDILRIKQHAKEWVLYTMASEVIDTYPTLADAQSGGAKYLKQEPKL